MELETAWRKSSKCGTEACVEVAHTENEWWIRDSKNPDSPILKFTKVEWDAFIAGVKADEFNR